MNTIKKITRRDAIVMVAERIVEHSEPSDLFVYLTGDFTPPHQWSNADLAANIEAATGEAVVIVGAK
jgi:hypothetical protein